MRYWRRIVAPIIALRIRTGRENRGRVGRGGISSLVSNSHREHLLRPSSAILISNIDNNPENNGISQGMCFPPLAPARPIFPIQSSKTSNSSGRMLCNEQAVFEKVQDNDSTKNAIFESNIFPFTHESIRLFYFVTV